MMNARFRRTGPFPTGLGRRPMSFGPRRGTKLRLVIALVIIGYSLFSYIGSREFNPVTGETQYISLTPRQEIALGLQAAPGMIEQHGGLYLDERLQAHVDEVGRRLVNESMARQSKWNFDFHLLRDPNTINAFALPGGQCFITAALYQRLETEGQLAGVLGHEIGHVLARHSAQRIAKSKLTQGLTGAVIAASGDPNSARLATMVGQMINMKYGRDDELQSDQLGVQIMADAGYDPQAMVQVMEILAESRSGDAPPEFFSTHPNPENRIGEINRAIRAVFPEGVPEGLQR